MKYAVVTVILERSVTFSLSIFSYLETSMGYSEDENTSAEILGSKSAYFK